jgi:hypothetical protein
MPGNVYIVQAFLEDCLVNVAYVFDCFVKPMILFGVHMPVHRVQVYVCMYVCMYGVRMCV